MAFSSDTPTEGGGGGGFSGTTGSSSGGFGTSVGGAVQAGGGIAVGAVIAGLHAIFPGVKSFGAPSGRMAARGAAAAAFKYQQQLQRLGQIQYREQSALRAFEAQTPGGVGQIVEFNPDPKLQKIATAINQVKSAIQANTNVRKEKKLLKKERKLEAKEQRRALTVSGSTEVRVTDLYGANAGYWFERGAPPPLWLTQGRA
jgi:hypothetical protein